jgi:hypothetical protein
MEKSSQHASYSRGSRGSKGVYWFRAAQDWMKGADVVASGSLRKRTYSSSKGHMKQLSVRRCCCHRRTCDDDVVTNPAENTGNNRKIFFRMQIMGKRYFSLSFLVFNHVLMEQFRESLSNHWTNGAVKREKLGYANWLCSMIFTSARLDQMMAYYVTKLSGCSSLSLKVTLCYGHTSSIPVLRA